MNIGNIMKPLQEKMGDVKELLQSIVDNMEAQTELLKKILDKLPDNPKKDESENKEQVCKNPEQSS